MCAVTHHKRARRGHVNKITKGQKLARIGLGPISAVRPCYKIEHALNLRRAQMRDGRRFGIVGRHTKLEPSAL